MQRLLQGSNQIVVAVKMLEKSKNLLVVAMRRNMAQGRRQVQMGLFFIQRATRPCEPFVQEKQKSLLSR
jgi:hypothetical protein